MTDTSPTVLPDAWPPAVRDAFWTAVNAPTYEESAAATFTFAQLLAAVSPAVEPPADQTTPSRRTGLRDLLAAAIHADLLSTAYRRDQGLLGIVPRLADAVLAVLYREWPWLRAEAEDAEPADQAASPAAECSAQNRNYESGLRLCIRAAQHHGDHIDERGFHWSDTVAVYPVSDGTFRRGKDVRDALRRMADETATTKTQAAAPSETDEERADREETERDHARGDHTHCGITCEVEMPTEHLRNFVIAKGYPGTKGALAELERRAAAGARQGGTQMCGECAHPKATHREGDDPVSPGRCAFCPDDDAWHDYQPAAGAQPATGLAAADNPTPLRWGLDDVLHGDDDTATVLLSGPAGEPYWLELEPERAAALRDALAGPGDSSARATALDVLRCLADPEPCRWEGVYCITHSWKSDVGRCPHGQAQVLLGGGR